MPDRPPPPGSADAAGSPDAGSPEAGSPEAAAPPREPTGATRSAGAAPGPSPAAEPRDSPTGGTSSDPAGPAGAIPPAGRRAEAEPDSSDPAPGPAEDAAEDAAPPPPFEDDAAPRRRGGCAGCLIHLLKGAGVVLALLVLYVAWQWVTWPDVAVLASERPESTAFIEDARDEAEDGEVAWSWVGYGQISPHLKRAVLVAEDIGFFDHDGFADEEVEKALEEAWKEKKLPRGASTLTQQTAKNLWLSPSYNPLRKVKEALLTRDLEEHLEKRRIFEIYLNVAQFGPEVFGAEAAARHYFGKSAAALSEGEAAQLAAALPRPRTWHPGVQDGRYRWKVNLVRQRMNDAGWLWKVI